MFVQKIGMFGFLGDDIMDSLGFQVIAKGNTIRVAVPDYKMNNKTDFSYDGVEAYMQVNTGGNGGHGDGDKPMLGVYKVYSVASGNLSLPYKVKRFYLPC